MDSKKNIQRRGCSGYHFFIQDCMAKMQQAKKPYKGKNATEDFAKEWNSLTPKEQEEYNKKSTSR